MEKLKKTLLLLTAIFLVITNGCRESEYVIPNEFSVITDNGGGTGTTTWRADNKYLLDGIVFVNDGQTLTIEPGTVIRAKTGQDINASALVVARGGRIIAEGTPEKPIIFTVEGDDLEGSVPIENNGLWGGVIVLGNAPVNSASGESFIEGIPEQEPRGIYGGNINKDNSGIIKYVSIRHGGTSIGEGNEINGLTLGGVGSETTLEHVEVISNRDDGFEFFGGTVNGKYLLSAFCGDDAFDFDLGYRGKCQFIVGLQAGATGDLLFELSDRESTPRTRPIIANATFIGKGMDENGQVGRYDNSSAGTIANSIFLHQKDGIDIEYSASDLDSYQQFLNGHIGILNNIFYNVGNNSALQILGVYPDNITDVTEQDAYVSSHFEIWNNELDNPGIAYNSQTIDVMNLIPVKKNTGEFAELDDEWFETTNFKGAMGNSNWLKPWSILTSEELLQ
ncbi:hypothetical protein [Marinilabilia rubra]|uniref:T9SS C-terminal target domain-containing protein n=1 Tax=Marinilabilia rubra TaxID=2162893 RepID=A0A2U2BCV4_9BACT|nr:hypothetical protein [Marinilabilia rubra]PWE00891.1 hypothetical protein DDZ16_03300 [Marinilabilia rubra]